MNKVTEKVDGFEKVFRDSKDGLTILKNGYFVDCNQSMLDLVGMDDREEFLGLTPFDLSPEYQPDGRLSIEKGLEKLAECQQQGSVQFEWMHKKQDGLCFWSEIILTKMTLNDEEVVHCNWRDISEKKALAIELAYQKETFETLFEESRDGLSVFDGQQYIDCNKAFVRMFGYDSKEEVMGLHPKDISPEFQADGRASKDAAKEIIHDSLHEGSVRFEWVHCKKDGTEFWTEVIVTKVTLQGVDLIYAVIRDISEKKELELKLEQQKLVFETLFSESQDGLTFYDGEKYLDCNKAFLSLMGFHHKDEVIGLNPLDLSPEYQPDGRTSAQLYEDTGIDLAENGKARIEWVHKKADGTEFWTEVIVAPLQLNGEEVMYSITRDISEKKALELQINERNAALRESNSNLENTIESLKQTQDKLVESEKMASLGSLVAGVAHEINTPIGVGLVGISQLMEESASIRKRYESGALTETDFEDFLNSSNELSGIVNKNLERTAQLVRGFKQIAVDQTSEDERQIDLKSYIEEIVYSLGSVTRKANVQVAVDCEENVQVVTNPGLLSQVLTNMIVNSMNHGFADRDSGNITITAREDHDNMFALIYKDDGRGISEENLPKIFNPFFTTNRGKGGTGLGLNVTYNIITNALGGSIKCRSKVGEGVEFDMSFKVRHRVH